ncbi:spliceosome associated factor 3, U4/U6 recycling protein [Rhinoderma darwinii]|uniref:spliceosome associated factor 3, U4/U6 recycling protein n=1 Tax=Rhinoderma darwinii TaxID=43563 RepID=UPI003F6749E0
MMAAAEHGLKEKETQRLGGGEEEEGEEGMESEEEERRDGSAEGTGQSSSDEEDEKENEAEIQRLEEQLSINAFDYNCHVDLIKLLRQEGELERLRRARQKMSELFPLTEEIWLDWLKDEMKMTEDGSSREAAYGLFEKAVKDYICPEIWLEYAQYSIGGMGEEGGIAKVRAIFERALTAVGLHMTKGSTIWDAYREFENAILGTIQPLPGTIPSAEQQQMLNAQLERIHTLFKRQLGVPLLDMETTYAEYEEWSEESIPEIVNQNYKKAVQQVEKYKSYEEALLAAETPKLAEYQAYIDFEVKEGDPARIPLIFERALADNCLVPDLWARYTQYLDRKLKTKELVLGAHDRAVRNCPWTVGLWKSYILALERHCVDHSTITETFEKALNAGFIHATDYVEIWQSYLDYLRRRVDFTKDSSKEHEELRAAFVRALDYLKQEVEEKFSESGDPSCSVMQNWARIEAQHCNNMQKARELWDSIMTKGNSKFANMWLEYYNLERAHGDTPHCRKALHRAVQCTVDYPEHVCDVLLTLERAEGSLEDWDAAVIKTEARLSRVNEQRAKAAAKQAIHARQEEEKSEQRKKTRAAKKPQKAKPGDKRKAEDEDDEEWGEDAAEQPCKKHRGEEQSEDNEAEEMETETGLFGRSTSSASRSQSKQKPPATNEQPRIPHNPHKDKLTVFVSNLPYNMSDPEQQLRNVFSGCGEISQVRVIYTNKGAFRGYCYVEFNEEKGALDALKMDRHEVKGRPMFVSPCVDKNKNPEFKVFKYSTILEKHKLFVSGLPFSCTKEELEEIFKEHGTIKEIRLVTNRSGKPKGLAYVDYENETQASQAVIKLDGTKMKDHTIKVAISNPPIRKQQESQEAARLAMSMVPRQTYGARGKGRTQVALLPRSLHRQNTPGTTKTENGTPQTPEASSGAEGEPRKMSNADFARMLLQK